MRNVADIVEANGKTIRQNNMEMTHTIPLGSLVEVCIENSIYNKIRLYICEHTKDSEGSLTYHLSISNDLQEFYERMLMRKYHSPLYTYQYTMD